MLPALNGLRALLALGIMFFHFTPPHMRLVAPVIDTAYALVAVFFLLSGYVLAYNYVDRPTPLVVAELMTGNSEQPALRAALAPRPKAPPRGERLGEGLGGEVGGHMRIESPPGEEAEDVLGVPVIEGREQVGPRHRTGQELLVT